MLLNYKLKRRYYTVNTNTRSYTIEQFHKTFIREQVKELFFFYEKGELTRGEVRKTLGISKSYFFDLVKEHSQNPQDFEIDYDGLLLKIAFKVLFSLF